MTNKYKDWRDEFDEMFDGFETDFGDESAQAIEKGGVMEVRFVGIQKMSRQIKSFIEQIIEGERADILAVFENHYWDSLEKDKDILLTHIKNVLKQTNSLQE